MQKSFTWTDLSCPYLLRRSDQRVVQAGSSQSIFTDWRSSKDNIMLNFISWISWTRMKPPIDFQFPRQKPFDIAL